ncbi:hypothetical protein SAMN05421595_0242 [Austwickia chelonae]|uniref:Uncharacterized protein n=1 Tax=Austwickia chelonae NBRC 105200 TaxID=1184607 RepID=K6V681_9MICO|nr:hypothetical protein [Austwickia chelonae]GAB77738.1 hypothetical protein AUCHE_06_00100 [Austwickia chelonae NBRC 105200]SEV88579.1 hypothetical protein SAMN05421595_0242 [Austwickia chelonae]
MSSTIFSVATATLALSTSFLAGMPASASAPSMAPQSMETVALAPLPASPMHSDCPSGHACLKENFRGIVNHYYKYGTYNLTDVTGHWHFCNNQTGGAKLTLYFGYNGTGGVAASVPAGECIFRDMNPVNSFSLQP